MISTGTEMLFSITFNEKSKHFWKPTFDKKSYLQTQCWDEFLSPVDIRLLWGGLQQEQQLMLFHHLLQYLEPLRFQLACINGCITILAVGWTTSIFWRIVAPSLVIRVYPLPSLIILSMPLGPRLVRMQSATAEIMLEVTLGSLNVSGANISGFLVFVVWGLLDVVRLILCSFWHLDFR